jgi:hypothetical protein
MFWHNMVNFHCARIEVDTCFILGDMWLAFILDNFEFSPCNLLIKSCMYLAELWKLELSNMLENNISHIPGPHLTI